jgi:capsular exopolysaccharide synthesis family protein
VNTEQENFEEELSFEDIIKIFKKRFWWFFLTAFITGVITLIYIFTATPIYEASATIKVEPSSTSSPIGDIFGMQAGGSSEISTEIELIKSRRNFEKVIEELDLLEYYKNKAEDPETAEELDTNKIIKNLSEIISVSPVKDTNIVKITVKNEDPELAKNIANKLAEIYNELLKSLSKNEYTVRVDFIETQIPQTKEELDIAEKALREFKENNNVFLLDEEAKALLDFLLTYDKQLNTYNIQIEESRARIEVFNELLKKVDEEIISSETITINPIVTQLRNKIIDYKVELAGLIETRSPDDPRIIELKERLNEAEKQLKNQIETIVSSKVKTVNPEYKDIYTQLIEEQTKVQVLNSTINSIKKLRNEYQTHINTLPALEQQLMELQRNLKVKEELYILMLNKLEEAKIAEAGVIGTADIIDKAYTPELPVEPNKKLTAAIGGVLGIFLGILVVFIIEFMDKTVKDEEEIKRIIKKPVLGRIPRFEQDPEAKQPELIVKNNPISPSAESYKLLSTNIDFISTEKPKIISISSAGPGEGKSITAANVALSYAANGLKTLLLDADMRRPRIEKVFKIPRQNFGVLNHIMRSVPYERLIQTPLEEFPDFHIFPVGPIPPNPTAILTSKKFQDLIEDMKKDYDKIIIDLPPVLVAGDASIVTKYTDGMILVIRAETTVKPSLKIAYENLVTSGAEILGTVVNDITEKSNSYYYYYYYTQDGTKKKKSKK